MNSFVRNRLMYSCQNRNLSMGQFKKLDVTYRNLLRRMIRGGFNCIGNNDGDIRYKLDNEKVHAICYISDVSNFIWKQQNDYASHVIRMSIEHLEKKLMFNDDKYHRTSNRRVTPSLLEQVLKFNNSTIDNFINNSMKHWLENSTLSSI